MGKSHGRLGNYSFKKFELEKEKEKERVLAIICSETSSCGTRGKGIKIGKEGCVCVCECVSVHEWLQFYH